MKKYKQSCFKNSGFTLLEVMVALVIFSISLLGLAGLQSQSLQFSNSAYLRSQATYLAYDIIDRMRANLNEAKNGSYVIALGDTPGASSCYGTGTCSTAAVATADLYEWKTSLQNILPNGKGSIVAINLNTGITTTTAFQITVTWIDTSAQDGVGNLNIQAEI